MDDKDLIEKLKILLIYGKRAVDGKTKMVKKREYIKMRMILHTIFI